MRTRLRELERARICGCTTVGSLHIRRIVSHISTPPQDLALSKRVSEASLAFRREVWEERGFPEVLESEGEGFIEGRERDFAPLSFLEVIHSLLHEGNEGVRRGLAIKNVREPNGNHFPWSDELFSFITGLRPEPVPVLEGLAPVLPAAPRPTHPPESP